MSHYVQDGKLVVNKTSKLVHEKLFIINHNLLLRKRYAITFFIRLKLNLNRSSYFEDSNSNIYSLYTRWSDLFQ